MLRPMKLEAMYMPAWTDSVFDAKCKLLRGVWRVDAYGVQRVETMRMRYVLYDPAWARFGVLSDQDKKTMLFAVKFGEALDDERAVRFAASKYSFASILLGCVRRRVVSERVFWEVVRVRPEWFY